MRRFISVAVALILSGNVLANGPSDEPGTGDKPKIAFVTNGIANFWKIAETGALKAGKDLDCDVVVKMPTREGGRAANQKRILEQLLSQGVDAIAVSPVDPANQTDILNEVGNNCFFITHDSDAPGTNRRLYVGMSNYDAGRMVGELVKQTLPDGGNLVLFIGSMEQDNAKLRRQGVIDEVFGRSHDPSRFDDPTGVIKDDKYTILATLVDDFDDVRKKELPEQTLAKYKDIDCMIGLFEYNPPFIFDALKSAGKLGEIKVVGFDENERTLEEIASGNCVGTVVQNPYMYGYKSVDILQRLVKGEPVESKDGFVDIPARKITKENVAEFSKELKALVGK
jgi:ribose transport system substrate-binding protein